MSWAMASATAASATATGTATGTASATAPTTDTCKPPAADQWRNRSRSVAHRSRWRRPATASCGRPATLRVFPPAKAPLLKTIFVPDKVPLFVM
ncbi:hypothetical protein ONE63_006057 [Megalurothrips usitatus]|uniref:Secreted protein n=1 Tax=Megalurothrips usitatus TaxID=439358 RepID=A0AAV7XUT0_9NEOP|nr:hypothetical protein ONE63_006057 [Megalurothrips usitatus]